MQDGNGRVDTQPKGKSPKASPRGSGQRSSDYPAASDKTVKELLLTTRALQSELDKLKLINHNRRAQAFKTVTEKLAELKEFCGQHDIKWTECRAIWDRENHCGSR